MTEFLSAESMEVSVKPSFCQKSSVLSKERNQNDPRQRRTPYPWSRNPNELTDNREQVGKKLQATKRRFTVSQEHGATYRIEIVELNKLNPVRYVSHHEVPPT